MAGVVIVTNHNVDAYVLNVCSAIITKNQHAAAKLLEDSASHSLPVDLHGELVEVARTRPASSMNYVVRLSYYLPAWVQYVGQRLVLLSPRLGHWLLRKTKLHHRWY
jgi:hypothetical protein